MQPGFTWMQLTHSSSGVSVDEESAEPEHVIGAGRRRLSVTEDLASLTRSLRGLAATADPDTGE